MTTDSSASDRPLSEISTLWAALDQAHNGPPEAARLLRAQQLRRYSTAARRYLQGALADPDAADEVFQEFALRFVRGDFRRANPDGGSFRSYLKRVLSNLMTDHHRRQRQRPLPLDSDAPEPAATDSADEAAFLLAWREELFRRVWSGLREHEKASGKPWYTVLRARVDHPDLSSEQLAERISARTGKAVTAEWVRNRLHFARKQFAEGLLREVLYTLVTPSRDNLERELLDLGLLEPCREAFERWPPR